MNIRSLPDTIVATATPSEKDTRRAVFRPAGSSTAESLTRQAPPSAPREAQSAAATADNIRDAERVVRAMGLGLKYRVHEESRQIQVEIYDPETDKILKKIPADELLDLAATLRKKFSGLFEKDL
jgi:flagellar protein FlaG